MYAYAHMRNRTFSFLRVCAITHLHIWVDTDTGCGRGPAMDDHGGMAYGKERFRRESGRRGEPSEEVAAGAPLPRAMAFVFIVLIIMVIVSGPLSASWIG